MKKILMITAAILALGSLTAKAQMRSGVDTLTLDQVKYRASLRCKTGERHHTNTIYLSQGTDATRHR